MNDRYGELHDKYTEFVKSVKEGAENLRRRGIGMNKKPESEEK